MTLRAALACSVAFHLLALAAEPASAQTAPSGSLPLAGQPGTATAAPDTGAIDPVSNSRPQPGNPGAAAEAPATSAAGTGEIIVTGSRVARQGFEAPTPTKVLSAEDLQRRGSTNVGDFLNEIPAFRPSQNNQTNTTSFNSTGQVYADLRGLGNIRTLTLVDGRRHVPSSSTGQVDLNLIPTILVERVEVVTGGASAAYGSDAISGVVNVLLDKKLRGLKGDISNAISEYGDNWERRASLGFGTSFADDRGSIVVGGEYVTIAGVTSYDDRPWSTLSDEIVSYPATRTAGLPSRTYAVDARFTNSTVGGLINGSCAAVGCTPTALAATSPFLGIQFAPGGVPAPFSYGNDAQFRTGTASDGTSDGMPTRLGFSLVVPVKRYVGFAHVDYGVSDTIKVFAEGGYARSGSIYGGASPRDSNASTNIIRRDNAFLPTSIRNLMVANNVQAISLGRSAFDYGQTINDNKNVTVRGTAGASGELGGGWTWDAYYEYGRNKFTSLTSQNRILAKYAFAVDAVVNPANGQITCRALLPSSGPAANAAAANCVPINLFGPNSPSDAAAAYVLGTTTQTITTTQHVGAANLRGTLFNTWAGPVAAAVGGEIRRDRSVSVVDPLSVARGYFYSNPQPFAGTFNTKEGYIEAAVPLAKDLPFARSLDLNGAFRYTDYSVSGAVKTWKVGATYEPVDGVKFRGVLSRDIRAPNANELFSSFTTASTVRNPFSGVTAAYPIITQPSASLQPEKARTKIAGIVLSPRFTPGLNMSVDYYDINLKGAIASYGAQQVLDNCFAETNSANPAGGFFCTLVVRNGTTLVSASTPLFNLASIRTRGVDFDVNYRHRLGAGNLVARVFGTYVPDLTTDDAFGTPRTYNAAGVLVTKGSVINRAGQVGGFTSGINTGATSLPHWQVNGSLTYADDLFSVTAQGRYLQGGKADKSLLDESDPDYNPASPISVTRNQVSARFYLNLSGSVNILNEGNRKVQLYTVVSNATNVAPPHPDTSVAGLYDRIGRYYRLGVRFAY
jgi:iron complex outermembrane receptor protein